ncbi:MAG TPA: hypothetical protein VF605_19835 [Allosphingosinicella sp.]
MSAALILAATFAQAQAQAPEEERPLESWTCTVSEQFGENVGGMLQMMVYPDAPRGEMSYYVHWSAKRGHMAEQRMSWIWIPLDAVRLWKPDEIEFSLNGERTDEAGSVIFQSPKLGRIYRGAERLAKRLPTFETTWVKIEEAHLIAQLWSAWPWTAEHSDGKGVTLGSQAILLPGPDASQAMFARLRARLYEQAAEPAANCHANLGQTQQELEESQIHWGTPIRRPDLTSVTPVTSVRPPR